MNYETEHMKNDPQREDRARRSAPDRRATAGSADRAHSAARRRRRKKKRGIAPGIIVLVLIALLGLLGIEAMSALSEAKGMVSDVDRMKEELSAAAACALNADPDGAGIALNRIDELARRDRATLAKPLFRIGGLLVPDAGADLKTADGLLELVQRATALARQPLGELPAILEGEAPATDRLDRALDLFDTLSPELLSLADTLIETPDFRLEQLKGKLTPYQAQVAELRQTLTVAQEGSALARPLLRQVEDIGLPDKEMLTDPEALAAKGLAFLELYDSACPQLIDWAGRMESALAPAGETLQRDWHRMISLLPLGQRASGTLRPILQQLVSDGQQSGASIPALLGAVSQLRAAAPQLNAMLDEVESALSFETPQLAEKTAEVRDWISLGRTALLTLEQMPEGLLTDLAQTVKAYPLSDLKSDNGYNLKLAEAYLRVYQSHKSEITELLSRLEAMELSPLPLEQQGELRAKLAELRELLDGLERYLPLIDVLLGKLDHANYLLAAQNTAELRACGGFPGNLTMITIRDGWLDFGYVGRIYDVLPFVYPGEIQPPLIIKELFGSFCQTQIRDASFNPHFPFVASAWAYAFESDYYPGEQIDGIISCTPKLVQELVALTGDIQLMNGDTINGENTLRYLMHDVYFLYHTNAPRPEGNEDAIFDQVFDTVLERMFEDIDLDRACGLLDIVERCADERVIMLWLADEAGEAVVRETGLSGALNYDPDKPQIGIYFSVQDSNKVGYYVDLQSSLGEGTPNADGSVTYPVTVVCGSVMTEEDIERAKGNDYKLMGTYDNNILSSLYFTAPMFGSISEPEYEVSYARAGHIYDFPGLLTGQYEGLTFKYHRAFFLEPGQTITFRFTVTTAPGVTAVPSFSQTPTCTGERG